MIGVVRIPVVASCIGGEAPLVLPRRDVHSYAWAGNMLALHPGRRRGAQPKLQISVTARNQAKHVALTKYYWFGTANRGMAIRDAEA